LAVGSFFWELADLGMAKGCVGSPYSALFRQIRLIPPFGGAVCCSILSAAQRIQWRILGSKMVHWSAFARLRPALPAFARLLGGAKFLNIQWNEWRQWWQADCAANGGADGAARRPYQERLRICQPKQAKEKDLRGAEI
jgi:hypothetical protein